MSLLLATAVAPLALSALGVSPTAVDPADQAAADAAVAVFNERLNGAGWSSTGPFTQAAPEGGGEETEFGPCLDGFELYLDYTDVHFDGETARAFSDNFELVSSEPVATGALADYGNAGAVVLSAEESALDILDTFVGQLGAKETGSCITEQPAFQSLEEVMITNDADVGVGDASARLDLVVTVDIDGTKYTNAATIAAARVDRSLVVVVSGGSGDGAADFDPIAELAAMVDSFR